MTQSPSEVPPLYQDDLANIHVEGYGFHWTGAADALLDWFEQFGISSGTVVDLGCGGGQWLGRLAKEGYETCGIDVSASMIRLAKKNAPKANYLCGSFAEVAIPECHAVTSLGEPLNYLNSGPAMRRTMRNVFVAQTTRDDLFCLGSPRPRSWVAPYASCQQLGHYRQGRSQQVLHQRPTSHDPHDL